LKIRNRLIGYSRAGRLWVGLAAIGALLAGSVVVASPASRGSQLHRPAADRRRQRRLHRGGANRGVSARPTPAYLRRATASRPWT